MLPIDRYQNDMHSEYLKVKNMINKPIIYRNKY